MMMHKPHEVVILKSHQTHVSQFYKDVKDFGASIYSGITTFTTMSLTFKLLYFQNMTQCSRKTFDSLLALLSEVLPKDHTLLDSYYKIKTIMNIY